MKEGITYSVKKGPADPFRGDWYIEDQVLETKQAAAKKAASLTLACYRELGKDWEQYGYEWSVFENTNGVEKKIWEGYKYIQSSKPGNGETPDLDLGYL